MGIEIERNFLVDGSLWRKVHPQKSISIKQGYLVTEPQILVRSRIADDIGYITIKGSITGISRPEYEYEIPVNEAAQLMDTFAKATIEKTRHYVLYEGKMWMVDEFKGMNEGLITAEIELTNPQEYFEHPEWLMKEVTSDFRYLSSSLAITPYCTWSN
jgi:CYTH domain-containing protein